MPKKKKASNDTPFIDPLDVYKPVEPIVESFENTSDIISEPCLQQSTTGSKKQVGRNVPVFPLEIDINQPCNHFCSAEFGKGMSFALGKIADKMVAENAGAVVRVVDIGQSYKNALARADVIFQERLKNDKQGELSRVYEDSEEINPFLQDFSSAFPLPADFIAGLPKPDSPAAIEGIKAAVKKYRLTLPVTAQVGRRPSLMQTYAQVAKGLGFKTWEALVAVPAQQWAQPLATPHMLLRDRSSRVVRLDLFPTKSRNFNILATGQTGSGKTIFLQHYASCCLAAGYKVRVLDFGASWRHFAAVVGGKFHDFGASSDDVGFAMDWAEEKLVVADYERGTIAEENTGVRWVPEIATTLLAEFARTDRTVTIIDESSYFLSGNNSFQDALRLAMEGAHGRGSAVVLCAQSMYQLKEFSWFLEKVGIRVEMETTCLASKLRAGGADHDDFDPDLLDILQDISLVGYSEMSVVSHDYIGTLRLALGEKVLEAYAGCTTPAEEL